MPSKAEKYEVLYPGTGAEDDKKEERFDRMSFKADSRVRSNRRINRGHGIVVPPSSSAFDSDGRLKP